MAIVGFFGFPGSGKTTVLSAIADMEISKKNSWLGLPHHANVLTTFSVPGAFRLNFDDLGKYDMSDSLIIIDEVSLYADNRQFKTFASEKMEFFKMHRHYNTDVIWCSQSATDADRKIRTSTDYMYLIEPYYFNYSIIKPICKGFDISNDIQDKFYLASPLQWIFVNRAKYYHLFDSYACKKLPFKDFQLWA